MPLIRNHSRSSTATSMYLYRYRAGSVGQLAGVDDGKLASLSASKMPSLMDNPSLPKPAIVSAGPNDCRRRRHRSSR
jgi:hypothetical protein